MQQHWPHGAGSKSEPVDASSSPAWWTESQSRKGDADSVVKSTGFAQNGGVPKRKKWRHMALCGQATC
jgi:hypothetical protein